jgi:hypothetical protein
MKKNKLLKNEIYIGSPVQYTISLNTLLMSFGLVMSVELIVRYLATENQYNPTILLGAARLFEITLMIIIVQICQEGRISSIGLERSTIFNGIKRGLIWSAGFGAVVLFTSFMLFLSGINPLKLIYSDLPSSFDEPFLFFFVTLILGPVAEEIFFRGLLYGFLRRWGILAAIFLTTIIFTGVHLAFSEMLFTPVIGGIVFAIAYEIEKKLMVPIVIHGLGNMAILSVFLIR